MSSRNKKSKGVSSLKDKSKSSKKYQVSSEEEEQTQRGQKKSNSKKNRQNEDSSVEESNLGIESEVEEDVSPSKIDELKVKA